MRCSVTRNYLSSLAGPFRRGDVLELPEELAMAINRDSPGTLLRVRSSTPIFSNVPPVPKWRVNWSYRSSLAGPFVGGDVVEMREEMASRIDQDSPGVLTQIDTDEPALDAGTIADRAAEVEANRGRGEQEPISKAGFMAVRD